MQRKRIVIFLYSSLAMQYLPSPTSHVHRLHWVLPGNPCRQGTVGTRPVKYCSVCKCSYASRTARIHIYLGKLGQTDQFLHLYISGKQVAELGFRPPSLPQFSSVAGQIFMQGVLLHLTAQVFWQHEFEILSCLVLRSVVARQVKRWAIGNEYVVLFENVHRHGNADALPAKCNSIHGEFMCSMPKR